MAASAHKTSYFALLGNVAYVKIYSHFYSNIFTLWSHVHTEHCQI